MGRRHLMLQLSLLLAVCVLAAELVVCRIYDPALYRTVTAPARAAAAAVDDWRRTAEASARTVVTAYGQWTVRLSGMLVQASDRLGQRLSDWLRPDPPALPELPEGQLIAEPENLPPPVSRPDITWLEEADGLTRLTGSGIATVYFNQGEDPWAEQLFGTDPIGRYGCGPTAMAMAVSTLSGQTVDPAEMAAWAAENGYWCPRSGSYHTLIQGAAEAFGLEAESLSEYDEDTIKSALLSGKLVVTLMGPGHFTQRGHFILLRGITLSGNLLVADPNSVERSLAEWPPEIILSELSSSTSGGAPVWVISPPAQ